MELPYQSIFFWQQEAITENHNLSNAERKVVVGVPRPKWDIYNMSLTPKAWGTLRKRGWPAVRVRGLG